MLMILIFPPCIGRRPGDLAGVCFEGTLSEIGLACAHPHPHGVGACYGLETSTDLN